MEYQPPDDNRTASSSVEYAELHAHSAYSFLDGARTPEELVEEAAMLDLRAIALTDHNGLYGAVRFAEAAAELGEQCAFGLALIAPQLPPFDVPAGHTEDSWLRGLAMAGAELRYGPRAQARQAYAQLEHELEIIAQLGFPGYFLVVYDITRFCRENNILCQGRGSAANSAVCYALGVTAVDPVANELLFERFLSPVRDGPPDIDIDIESDQREKVIQYVYGKYGRDYAAQVANVITYRGRIAVRDKARALGFSQGQQDAWSKQVSQWSGLPSDGPDIQGIPEQVIDLATQIQNLLRHMGIHSGGMVICDRPIADVCPVEWARMENRSVLQWDKDDCGPPTLCCRCPTATAC
jgi:error-prone DNA polymerase